LASFLGLDEGCSFPTQSPFSRPQHAAGWMTRTRAAQARFVSQPAGKGLRFGLFEALRPLRAQAALCWRVEVLG
jgi:hypothetical protein